MKYTLENFFDALDTNELDDILPKNFEEPLPKRALKRIEKKALQKSGIKARHTNLKIFLPAAVCLALTAGIGGYAIAADVKEYNSAVEFFEENGLSAEGLNRAEVKAVYRDITTNSFTNSKTAQVLRNSVKGTEILQAEPTPEELETLWNNNVSGSRFSSPDDTVNYVIDYEFEPEAQYYEWDKIIVECRQNGNTLWKTEFPTLGKNWGDDELYVEKGVMTSNGTALYGQITHWTNVTKDSISNDVVYSFITRVDENGNKLWQRELHHGFNWEYIHAVLDNGDGTWAVLSEGDFKYLCVTQFDIDGNELSFSKTMPDEENEIDIQNAIRLGDGYLVQFRPTNVLNGANIVKLGRDGKILDKFVYESDDCDYCITDMAQFEGKVYLSAYALPKMSSKGFNGIWGILESLEKDVSEITSEELTSLLRDNYTAVLLVCDTKTGIPETFYSAKGSLGGELDVSDNTLRWNAESINGAGYSPYTNAFSFAFSGKVYRYSFDKTGTLLGCEDTGEIASHNR